MEMPARLVCWRKSMLPRTLLFGLACGVMQAGPVCVQGTLTSYLSLASGCSVSALGFSNFAFNDNGFESSNNIQVLPSYTAFAPGLVFSGLTPAGPGVTATFSFNYTIASPWIMVGQNESLDPPFGNDVATELLCLNQLFGGGANCADNSAPFSMTVSNTVPPASLSESLSF